MKLVDVPDSKSGVVHPTCRFDSGHRHIFYISFLFSGVEPPVLTSRKIGQSTQIFHPKGASNFYASLCSARNFRASAESPNTPLENLF